MSVNEPLEALFQQYRRLNKSIQQTDEYSADFDRLSRERDEVDCMLGQYNYCGADDAEGNLIFQRLCPWREGEYNHHVLGRREYASSIMEETIVAGKQAYYCPICNHLMCERDGQWFVLVLDNKTHMRLFGHPEHYSECLIDARSFPKINSQKV